MEVSKYTLEMNWLNGRYPGPKLFPDMPLGYLPNTRLFIDWNLYSLKISRGKYLVNIFLSSCVERRKYAFRQRIKY